MSDHYKLDDEGNPIRCTTEEWGHWFEANVDQRIVKKTQTKESEVSTVFLGLDHAFGGGRPLIYESLVFGGPMENEMNRYSTKEEALKGHAELVDAVNRAELTKTAIGKAAESFGRSTEEGVPEDHLRTLATGEPDDQPS